MTTQSKDQAADSQPRDKSLAAYKGWITEIARRLTTKTTINLTESEWIANWKEYWNEIAGSRGNPKLHSR